ncbi:MAG: dephospho-CoA kinase [Propionibacteriaceae bacterium]|jgi:dephospho-CoA kinase|nr:dephospho-CoA kinase [Propionibacteriaceae bacterium]
MLRIALTGPIAAGKSVVSARLRQLGLTVLDADELAHAAIAPGSAGAREVGEIFGPTVMTSDEVVDRAALGAVVFADPAARQRLEAIIHPQVSAQMADLAAAAEQLGEAAVVCDIPLLIETGQALDFDLVLVVEAPADLRLSRLVNGRGLPEPQARQRIAAQATPEQRAAVADIIFDGSGSVEALQAQVDRWWRQHSGC